jgi:chromosome segregation ATPase
MSLRGWHPDAELRNLLAQVKKLIDTPQLERNTLMALSKEVQDQADRTKELKDIVQSVDQGMKALAAQVSDLTSKLAAVPTAPAQAMSDEDKAALVQSANDTQDLINTLKSDIPANTAATSDQTPPSTPSDQGTPPVTPS